MDMNHPVTRQLPQAPGQPPAPGMDGSYANLSRSPGAPYNAQQPNTATSSGSISPPPPAALMPGAGSAPASEHSQPIPRNNAPSGNDGKRPDTMYSAVYNDEDAYGGY